MESSDTIHIEDKISSDETVQESCCADDEVSLKCPHKCDEHDETAKQESAQKSVPHKDCAISTSEPKSSCKEGLDKVGGKEGSWKSCIKEEITDSNSTNLQTLEATSLISSPQMIHEEKEIQNSYEKDGEKCKEEVSEEEKVLEVSSSVDEMKRSKENISVDVNMIRKTGAVTSLTSQESAGDVTMKEESNEVENRRNWRETQSTLMKEPFERVKGGEGDSFQKNANRYEERMRFSTRNQKNGLPSWSEGLRTFRQCLKNAEFLTCISPSEFSLPQDIRLYRHRSLFKPSFSSEIRKTVRKTKSANENGKLVNTEAVTLKSELLSSSNVKPSENNETQEKPSKKPPTRNSESIRRAKGILFNRKINDSAVRKSLRQKVGALNAKKKLRNDMSGLCATRKGPSQSLKSNRKKLGSLNAKNKLSNETSGLCAEAKISSRSLKSKREEDLMDKEKASNEKQCCESKAVCQQQETELPESDNINDKQFSPTNSPHLQKPSQIHPRPGRKSKFAHRKRKFKSRGPGHQSGRYVKRCNFTGQLEVKKRSGKEQTVNAKLIKEFLKRKVGLPSFPNNASCGVEHLQTSVTSTKSQMVSEQKRKSNKLNFNEKRASTVSQSSETLMRQDADYLPQSSDMSDSEMSGSSNSLSVTPASSRVGSPEIEIDVDLSQDCDAIQQDELMSQAVEDRDEPPSPPDETGNVQPRKLPIFRKLPNPSSDPVAVFYYNPEATMLRRCSKYHSCCQQSATAAGVTKRDSSTQWEDPSVLYDFLKLKALPGLHKKLLDRGLTLPSYAIVNKKNGRYKIKGKSDVSLPHFSTILTATQDKKKKNLNGRIIVSNSNPGSSQSASTPLPTASTSGLQQTRDAPAFKLQLRTPICPSSSFQVVSQADMTAGIPSVNSSGVSARSISVLKDSLMLKHPPTTLVIKNSVSAKPAAAGGTQPVTLPSVSPGVEMHKSVANTGVDTSHFLFKDGILWQKVLKEDMFVWSKVQDGQYLVMNQLSAVPPLGPQSSVK